MASGNLRLERTSEGVKTSVKLFNVKPAAEETEDPEEIAANDIVMDIDSKDDAWLLDAAKQFECSDNNTEAVQEKYKVEPLNVDRDAIR